MGDMTQHISDILPVFTTILEEFLNRYIEESPMSIFQCYSGFLVVNLVILLA